MGHLWRDCPPPHPQPDLLPKNLLQRSQPTESLSGHSCGSATAPLLSQVYSRLPSAVAEHGGTGAASSCTVQASPNRQPLFGNCQSALPRPPQDSAAWSFPPTPPSLFLFMQNLHQDRKALLASSCFLFLSPYRWFSQPISCTYDPSLASASQKTPPDTTVMGCLIIPHDLTDSSSQ